METFLLIVGLIELIAAFLGYASIPFFWMSILKILIYLFLL
jgi:hypothetical protein